jgi:hypothetical protein
LKHAPDIVLHRPAFRPIGLTIRRFWQYNPVWDMGIAPGSARARDRRCSAGAAVGALTKHCVESAAAAADHKCWQVRLSRRPAMIRAACRDPFRNCRGIR